MYTVHTAHGALQLYYILPEHQKPICSLLLENKWFMWLNTNTARNMLNINIISTEIIKVLNCMLMLGLYKTALLGKRENTLCFNCHGFGLCCETHPHVSCCVSLSLFHFGYVCLACCLCSRFFSWILSYLPNCCQPFLSPACLLPTFSFWDSSCANNACLLSTCGSSTFS